MALQAEFKEIPDPFFGLRSGLRVGLCDIDRQQHAHPERMVVRAVIAEDRREPLARHAGGRPVGARGQEVVEATPGAEGHRLGAQTARHPDRRMRRLKRPGPDVDVAQGVVRPLVRERAVLGPGPHDQLDGFVEPPARLRRGDVVVVGLRAATHGEARDQRPPLIESIIAYSSATRSGFRCSGNRLPKTTSFARSVRWVSAAAITLGEGISP